jgi:hypothetical protein
MSGSIPVFAALNNAHNANNSRKDFRPKYFQGQGNAGLLKFQPQAGAGPTK